MQSITAAVVGLGALGNEVVRTLALLGTGKLLLIDHDVVESRNLTRSVFYRKTGSIGRHKSIVMAESIQAIFPDTAVVAADREIARIGYGEFEGVSVLFGCVDNDLARLDIAYVSTQLGIPVVDGGLTARNCASGRVSVFPGSHGACYSCLLTSARRAELLTAAHSVGQSCWDDQDIEDERPSTPTMASIIGGMQVELGLQWLSESPRVSYSVTVALAPELRMDRIGHRIAPDCPMHEASQSRVVVNDGTTFDEALEASGGHTLLLDMPVCAGAGCRSCGHAWRPMKNLRAFRTHGACPSCGSRQIAATDALHSIERASSWASYRLADLDQPANHRYVVLRNGDRSS